MFSFIKKYTETMQGISFYPIFSMLVFVGFFVGAGEGLTGAGDGSTPCVTLNIAGVLLVA
jgi:hypothetical protein